MYSLHFGNFYIFHNLFFISSSWLYLSITTSGEASTHFPVLYFHICLPTLTLPILFPPLKSSNPDSKWHFLQLTFPSLDRPKSWTKLNWFPLFIEYTQCFWQLPSLEVSRFVAKSEPRCWYFILLVDTLGIVSTSLLNKGDEFSFTSLFKLFFSLFKEQSFESLISFTMYITTSSKGCAKTISNKFGNSISNINLIFSRNWTAIREFPPSCVKLPFSSNLSVNFRRPCKNKYLDQCMLVFRNHFNHLGLMDSH